MDEKTLARILDVEGIINVVHQRTVKDVELNKDHDYGEVWYTQLDMLLQDLLRDEILMVMARRIVVQYVLQLP